MRGLSPVGASGGHSSSRCMGLSLLRPLVAEHGFRRAGSVVVAHGLSCSAACGIFPDQGSNPCALHRQKDSQRLRHQGSPVTLKGFIMSSTILKNVLRASLVAQWLRIRLPMQGTRARALIREDPTCCGATKPVRHNC